MKYLFLIAIFFVNLFAYEAKLSPEEKDFLQNNLPLKLHNEMNWPPYNFNENGTPKGFSIDYMNLIAKKLNIDVEYISNKSWDEFIEMLKKDELDAIINISKNAQREKYFDFTTVFHVASNAIYVKKGNEHIDSLEKLEGKTIVMPKGFFAQQLIQEHYPKIKQILVKDSLEALKLLSLGKAEATIGKKNVLDYIISTKNISGVLATNYVDDNRLISNISIATSKNKPLLNSILNKGHNLISDEELLSLKRKWFGAKELKSDLDYLSKNEKNYLENKGQINLCSLYEIKPIEFYEDGKIKGITNDLMETIEKKLDIKINSFKINSIDEAKKYLKENRCDMVTSIINDDFNDVAFITKPLITYQLAIVTQKGKPVVQNLEEVSHKPIAINKSSTLIETLKLKYPNLNMFKTNNDYETFEAVNNNKVYFALEPLPMVSYYMSKYAFNNIFISRYTNLYFSSAIAVNKNEMQLVEILNKTISDIDENRQNEILKKWTNLNEKEFINYDLILKIIVGIAFILLILGYRQIILKKHNKKLKLANDEIKEKNLQILKQKELFEKIFKKSAHGVLIIKNDKIEDCNEASLKIFNQEKKEILGKSFYELSPIYQDSNKNSKESFQEKIKETIDNGQNFFEWKCLKSDSNISWLEIVLTAIEIDNQALIHMVIRDINKRKKMERELEILTSNLEYKIQEEIKKNEEKTTQLIQQSRLAQMGEMISMIAHQWRQPLTAILATSNNLLIKIMLNEKIDKRTLKDELELINEYSLHLSSTVDDFRNFFKTDKRKITCYLEDLIDKSINIIKTSVESKNIKLNTNYSFNKAMNLYSTEIQQVILNILKNSEDALVEKEIINKEITIKTYEENNNAIIEISDNGGGVKENIIDKIFDPYFTTKKSKEGSGLGLYMSKTIINEHCKGKLIATNIKDGILFKIILPIEN